MKKPPLPLPLPLLLLPLLLAMVLLPVFGGKTVKKEPIAPDEYFRIHVRADSDLACDQRVKYRVRDAVIAYLAPVLKDCSSKKEAQNRVQSRLSQIDGVANAVLSENGLPYTAVSRITRENFPTRVYDGVTLPGGTYDAVTVTLGSGAGANWWCVVYPPLCFIPESEEGEGVEYRSKLLELLEKLRN